MRMCPECGRHDERVVTLGDLVCTDQPFEAHWRGARLPLTTGEARLLHRLVARRTVAHEALEMLCSEDVDARALIKQQLSRTRIKLRAAGVPILIKGVETFGYRIVEIGNASC